jgi:hypothetical protein
MPLPPGAAVPNVPGLAVPSPGAPSLVLFYRADCGACELAGAVLPRFRAVAGLRILAVSLSDDPATRAFAAEHGWDAGWVLLDRPPWRASRAWQVEATPTWYLVDGHGRVATAVEGWDRAAVNALAADAARLAGVEAPVVSPPGAQPDHRPG